MGFRYENSVLTIGSQALVRKGNFASKNVSISVIDSEPDALESCQNAYPIVLNKYIHKIND